MYSIMCHTIEASPIGRIHPVTVTRRDHIRYVPAGTSAAAVAPGPVLAACDTITVTLHGKSAHGSQPHESLDPTYLAAMIVVRLQGIPRCMLYIVVLEVSSILSILTPITTAIP